MTKEKIHLVLAPIRSTYPENYSGKIVFLGSKDEDYLKKKNPKAIIEHSKLIWSDKDILISDNKYLSSLQNKVCQNLGNAINDFFKINYNEKYWKIFLGPSCSSILTFLYERWITIINILDKYDVYHCNFIDKDLSNYTSDDLDQLSKMATNDDIFNQIIYQKILNFKNLNFRTVIVESKNFSSKRSIFFYIKKIKIKNFLFLCKLIYKNFFNYLLIQNYKNKKFIYISSKIKNNFLHNELNSFFAQKNALFEIKNLRINKKVNFQTRDKIANNFKFNSTNDFEDFSKTMILKILPKCFVEAYKSIQDNNLVVDKKFKFDLGFILYDQLFGSDYNERDWIAKNFMRGSKLIFVQNGGGPLTSKCNTIKDVVNTFYQKQLAFGIKDEKEKNIHGVGLYRFPNKQINPKSDGNIIYTMFTPYGYSFNVSSTVPMGNEWANYMSSQEKLISTLRKEIQKKLVIRLKKRFPENHPYNDYFRFKKRLQTKFPKIKFDDNSKSLINHLSNSRLLVATLDTTTILETLSLNFPTLIMMDLNKFKISDEYYHYYEKLHDVGILNYNPSEAKNQVEKIFNNVNGWWNNNKLQDIREKFCEKFAYHPTNQEKFFVNKISKLQL